MHQKTPLAIKLLQRYGVLCDVFSRNFAIDNSIFCCFCINLATNSLYHRKKSYILALRRFMAPQCNFKAN